MNTEINQQPATIKAWLTERGVTDVAEHHIARALGVQRDEVATLLSAAPMVENLLNLNRLAQLRHLALAKRVWPNCTWLAWGARQTPYHPVIKLILDTFGFDLLNYVSRTFGEEIVLQYWRALEVPPEYDDIPLDYDAPDPYAGLPFEQIVDNPHLDEEEGGEFHVFGCTETAACFLWLIDCTFDNYPRDSVSWYHAVAFCRWLSAKLPEDAWPERVEGPPGRTGVIGRLLGGEPSQPQWAIRLPTEWEWQQAATGGNPVNEYPWGEWDNRRANTNEAGISCTSAVGMYPQGTSLVGALDMSGNVWEWCLNEYDNPENTRLGGESSRVLRGGAFSSGPNLVRCDYRYHLAPDNWDNNCGFRVCYGASPI